MHLRSFEDFSTVSENLQYHISNKMSILENVFRPGSEAFFGLLKEAREFYDNGIIEATDIDSYLFEHTDLGRFAEYEGRTVALDLPFIEDDADDEEPVDEAKKKNKNVQLNKPTRSPGPKKFQVYVRDPKTGNIKKIHFGDAKGGLTTKINNPAARKSFIARHKCSTKNDKMKPGYWACRIPRYKNLYSGSYSGFW